jgi:hypothetical protein
MSEIKKGDLVMVLRNGRHRCPNGGLFKGAGITGAFFTVDKVSQHRGQCRACGADFGNQRWAMYSGPNKPRWVPFHRLKKIDPPAESTGEQDTRRIKETA